MKRGRGHPTGDSGGTAKPQETAAGREATEPGGAAGWHRTNAGTGTGTGTVAGRELVGGGLFGPKTPGVKGKGEGDPAQRAARGVDGGGDALGEKGGRRRGPAGALCAHAAAWKINKISYFSDGMLPACCPGSQNGHGPKVLRPEQLRDSAPWVGRSHALSPWSWGCETPGTAVPVAPNPADGSDPKRVWVMERPKVGNTGLCRGMHGMEGMEGTYGAHGAHWAHWVHGVHGLYGINRMNGIYGVHGMHEMHGVHGMNGIYGMHGTNGGIWGAWDAGDAWNTLCAWDA